MNRYKWKAVALAVVGSLAISQFACAAGLGLNAESRAKIAKARTKRAIAAQNGQSQSESGREESACGSLDIGNVFAGKPGQIPREVTVIVTGDVINANNECKR
jgi:hypothetical protein